LLAPEELSWSWEAFGFSAKHHEGATSRIAMTKALPMLRFSR